jgi:hypothetical protein
MKPFLYALPVTTYINFCEEIYLNKLAGLLKKLSKFYSIFGTDYERII